MSVKEFLISSKKFEVSKGNFEIERRPGGWVILSDSDGNRFRLKSFVSGDLISVHLVGKTLTGKVIEKSYGQSGDEEEGSLVAQFPGKVIKVLVSEGEAVQKGQSMLLVEAMKMEFNVEAPSDAIVKRLLVNEGQQVLPGDRFIELSDE